MYSKATTRPGQFVPNCKPSGEYDNLQCQGSICYCVNKYGVQLFNTGRGIGQNDECPPPGTSLKKLYHVVVARSFQFLISLSL